eukprot:scaffold174848_cov30-Tisochrysis_lutea.AAC.2
MGGQEPPMTQSQTLRQGQRKETRLRARSAPHAPSGWPALWHPRPALSPPHAATSQTRYPNEGTDSSDTTRAHVSCRGAMLLSAAHPSHSRSAHQA